MGTRKGFTRLGLFPAACRIPFPSPAGNRFRSLRQRLRARDPHFPYPALHPPALPWKPPLHTGRMLHSLSRLKIHIVLGIEAFTSAASLHLYSDASNLVIGPKPVFPSFTPAQNSSTDRPMGVIAPIPVTTTLLLISASQSAAQTACNHIRNGQIAIPPSTEITCPVIYAPPSPARKATSSATSSGRPSLFRGICEIIPCFASSDIAAVISVAI